jgi:hypothetical protein
MTGDSGQIDPLLGRFDKTSICNRLMTKTSVVIYPGFNAFLLKLILVIGKVATAESLASKKAGVSAGQV